MEDDPDVFRLEDDLPLEIMDDDGELESIEADEHKWEALAKREPNKIHKILFLRKALTSWYVLTPKKPEP